MQKPPNPIVRAYSDLAAGYDEAGNRLSCWGRVADEAVGEIRLDPRWRTIAEVGCGTGRALQRLASRAPAGVELVGVEPAAEMRRHAARCTAELPQVRIVDGSFESLPLESGSVDFLFSVLAFHWTTAPERAVREIARVLRPSAGLRIVFIGAETGHEFIAATSPILRRYLGLRGWLESAKLRRRFGADETESLFAEAFPRRRPRVEESRGTYHDTLDGHWSWWVRVEGHLTGIPPERRAECDGELRAALAATATPDGIPYTVHLLRVSLEAS
jgi:SAM-dependent methyltransferase